MQVGTDFVHVILTRFNLATPGRESALRNQPGWLAGRFELFERYCLPTLAAQTRRRLPLDRLLRRRHAGAVPRPHRGLPPGRRLPPLVHPAVPRRAVGDLGPGGARGRGAGGPLAAVDPARQRRRARGRLRRAGAGGGRRRPAAARRLQPDQRLRLRRPPRLRPRPPVATPSPACSSPGTTARTVADVQHMHLAEAGPVVQVGGPGGWLQVVHGGNVSNKIRGRRVPPAELAGRFPAVDRPRRRGLGARHRRREPAARAAARAPATAPPAWCAGCAGTPERAGVPLPRVKCGCAAMS